MKLLVRSILSIYSMLLHLYPRQFRIEFNEEMKSVFAQRLADKSQRGLLCLLRASLRELWELPVNGMQQHLSSAKESVTAQKGRPYESLNGHWARDFGQMDKTHSWRAALAGMILFLPVGLFLTLNEIPYDWQMPAWLSSVRGILLFTMLILPAIGFGVGFVKGFPRWSYPYVVYLLLLSLYMMRQPTPSLRLFGYAIASRDLLGWRAWIPCLAILLIALLISRSFRPVMNLFSNIWNDWTLLTWAMFGFLLPLVGLAFDEMDRLYSLPFMVLITLIAAGTALLYLRSMRPRQKMWVLFGGALMLIAVGTVAPAIYWGRNGFESDMGPYHAGTILLALMLSPAIIGLLHRSIDFWNSA